MVAKTLVNADLDRASQMVRILEAAGFRLNVAILAHLSEYEDNRLIVASPDFGENPARDIGDAFRAARFDYHEGPVVNSYWMDERFIRDLRREYRKTKLKEGDTIGYAVIGPHWIEHAYVFRLS